MPKRNEPESSGSTDSLNDITSESESDHNFSSETEEPEQDFMKRGRPSKNRYNMSPQINQQGPLGNQFNNQPQMQYQNYMNFPQNNMYQSNNAYPSNNMHPSNNMLYRNVNQQRQPQYGFNNPGLPQNYRTMGYPSNLGPTNPSYIGNMPQYGGFPVQNFRPQYPQNGYPPTNYGYPQQYNKQPYQANPYSQYYMPQPQMQNAQMSHQNYQTGQQGNRYTPPLPPRVDREKRREERLKKRKKEVSDVEQTPEFNESEDLEETEVDYNEKLLDFREDHFFVKFRCTSYIHCAWVAKEEVTKTRAGTIKAKRFLTKLQKRDYPISLEEGRSIKRIIDEDFNGQPPFDPEFIKIDRIISVDQRMLVKWKKLAYELSTLEFIDDIKDLEGFDEEIQEFKKRNIIKKPKVPIDWRPAKDSLSVSHTFKNGNNLRDYQMEGLNWLLNRWYYKQGCIMADEMGLGKTVQSVAFVNKLFETGYHFPVLVVAPLSTLIHWEREFKNWTDLRVLMYHGNNIARDLIHDYEFDNGGLLFDVMITTYEMVMSGIKHLDMSFGVGIFDEAHRLKNANSKAFQTLMTIQFNHKILLSGTPLQNNLTELWALLYFLDPVRNESLNYFLESYKLEKSEDVDRLKTLLKPVMLRRMKDDVEKIPIKEETIVEVELTMIQKQFYRAILEKNMSIFESNTPNLLNIMMELRKCCIHPYLVRGAEEKILHDYKLRRKIDAIKSRNRTETEGSEVESETPSEKTTVSKGSGQISPINGFLTKDSSENQISQNENQISPNENQISPDENQIIPEENQITPDNIQIPQDENAEYNSFSQPLETGLALPQDLVNETDITPEEQISFPPSPNVEETWSRKVYTEELSVDDYYKILIQSSGKLVLLDKLLEKLKGQHKVLVFSQMTRCLDLLADYLHYKKYKFERIDGAVRGDCRQAAIDRFSAENSESFVFLLCTRAGGMGINLTSADTCVIFDSDWNPQNDLQAQARCHRIGQTKNVKIYRLITRNTYEREMFDKAGLKLGLDQAILQKTTKGVKKKEYIESLLKKGAWGVLMENDDAAQKFCEEDIDMMLQRRTQVIRHEEGQNVFSRASFQVEEEFDDPDFWQNLISRKKNAENELKIKKIIRRLGRQPVTNYSAIDQILSTTNDEMLKIFLTIFKKGLGAMFDDVENVKDKIAFIMRTCFAKIEDKDKELFKFHLEAYFKDTPTAEDQKVEDQTATAANEKVEDENTNPEITPIGERIVTDLKKFDPESPSNTLDHPIVKELAEKFLLKLQAVNILKYLFKRESLEMMKGGSLEEDRRIVNWVLSNGYDNWPTGVGEKKSLFRGKDRNDLNARVRKIVLSLNKMSENQKEREHEHEIDNMIMNYGRVTSLNETDLAEHIEEIGSKVEIATTQKRKRSLYGNLNKRIALIDALQFLEIVEVKRTTGLPRSWKTTDDENLVRLVRSKGIANTSEELNLTDEVVVRRLETLVSHQDEND